jgi:hypothetical protein
MINYPVFSSSTNVLVRIKEKEECLKRATTTTIKNFIAMHKAAPDRLQSRSLRPNETPPNVEIGKSRQWARRPMIGQDVKSQRGTRLSGYARRAGQSHSMSLFQQTPF